MVDQDGVVNDKNYQTTKNIQKFVNNLADYGVIIVPNSDTPVKRLTYNFEVLLGIKSSIIIGEKGAVVQVNDEEFLFDNSISTDHFINKLKEVFLRAGAMVVIGDSATWIRARMQFKPNSDLLIVDALRQQSIGFYLRTSDSDGIAQVNEKWAERGKLLLTEIKLPKGIKNIVYNSTYGIFIGSISGICKSNGFNFLKTIFPEDMFFMIGDDDIDIIEDNSVIHCAVANGSQAFKEKSEFVSIHPFTEGLEECLSWIVAKK